MHYLIAAARAVEDFIIRKYKVHDFCNLPLPESYYTDHMFNIFWVATMPYEKMDNKFLKSIP